MKKTKIFIVWCLVTSIFLMQMSVWGYKGEYNNYDPTTWKQDIEEYKKILISKDTPGVDLGNYGCAVHSVTAMFVKYGARQRGYRPHEYIEESEIKEASDSTFVAFEGPAINWMGTQVLSNGKLELYTQKNYPSLSEVKEYMSKGYGVIAEVFEKSSLNTNNSNHFVFLDYVDGDDIWIVDSGRSDFTKLSQYGPVNDIISMIVVYIPTDSNNKPEPLYKTTKETFKKAEQEGRKLYGNFKLKESDLVGLKVPKNMLKYQSVNALSLKLVDIDEESKLRAKELGEKINQREEGNLNKIFIIISTIFGFIMVLFGLIRMVLFISDWKVDTNLYRFVDFSKKPPFKDGAGGQTEINNHWSWVSNLVLIIFGTMIMTGQAFTMVINLLVMLQRILN